ncbi:MAG TPA: hypothetical protein VKG78_02295, partial [Opitutaceae bacterium]|nr:hypothetical protein [Opitutaceae bacterium]
PPLSGLTWAGNFSDISVAVSAADALLATESLVILKLPYPPAQPMSFPLAAGELYNPATNNVEVQRTPTIYVPFTAKKTGETLWTPAAGKRFRLLGWTIFATLECTGEFKDEAGETGILVPFEKKTATNSPPGIFNGYMSAKAGNKLVITLTGGAGVTGYVFGTEE